MLTTQSRSQCRFWEDKTLVSRFVQFTMNGTFMYRHVLQYFRTQGLHYAHVDTGLDDSHIPARKAYEAVGFDHQVPIVEYWMSLSKDNEGSKS